MSDITMDEPKSHVRKPGFLTGAALRLLTRAATVGSVERLSARFRRIVLEGPALKDVVWTAGQKLQIQMHGLTFRTYTPILWDAAAGRTEVVAYLHGSGPGARWADAARVGDTALLFGPRRSLDLGALERPALFVGDETSFGPALSLLQTACGVGGVRFVFEVNDAAESGDVLARLGLHDAVLIQRRTDDAHHDALEAAVLGAFEAERPDAFVLTGKAATIQRLNRTLRSRGAGSAALRTKAYWAPGKTGLD